MGGVFINYRGADTDTAAALIDRELAARFGSDRVFLDCRSIPAGADFVEELLARLRDCSVLLVVIGPRWLTLTDAAGRRRIDDPRDWIRREIVEALTGGLRVIPVLTGNVALPAEKDLPQDIAGLSRRQYVPLRRRYTSVDLAFLVERITEVDPELANVAARHQSSPGRVPPRLPAAVDHSAGTTQKHARRRGSVTRARRLSLVLLPIAASLLVTFLLASKTYRLDGAPHTSASAPDSTLTITTTPTGGQTRIYHSGSSKVFEGLNDNIFDLETGERFGARSSDVDLIAQEKSIDAVNRAQFGVLGATESDPSYSRCEGIDVSMWKTSLSVDEIATGGIYCIRTSAGNLGFFVMREVQLGRSGEIGDVEIRWVVWEMPK